MRIRAAINVSALIVPVVHPHLLRPVLLVSDCAGSLSLFLFLSPFVCLSVCLSVCLVGCMLSPARGTDPAAATIRAGDAYRRERGSSTSFTSRSFASRDRHVASSFCPSLARFARVRSLGAMRSINQRESSIVERAGLMPRIEAVPWRLIAEE